MRRWIPLLLVLAILAVEAAFLLSRIDRQPEGPVVPPPVPLPTSVVSLQGEVEAAPVGREEWRRLAPGELIREGERLRTGGDGRVEVRLGTRCRLVLGPAALLNFTSLDDPDTGATAGIRLDLDRGATLVTVEAMQRKDRFRLFTPTAVCGVRGTKFLVTVDADSPQP